MQNKRDLVLATRNAHKIEEMKAVLECMDVDVCPVYDKYPLFDVIEDGNTFIENALKKAREAFTRTGLPSLADDSGLEVDALDGRPGVHSSRFAGDEGNSVLNNELLLKMLQNTPDKLRTARFKTVMAFVSDQGELYVTGSCEGIILREEKGTGGFGYDPLFYYPALEKSFAQLTQAEKNRVSHRGNALKLILPQLKSYFLDMD